MTDAMLTVETVPAYVQQVGVLKDASEAVEIGGGNLNYAFKVTDGKTSVFLKQTPGYVKVLGPEAKISDERLVLERQAYAEWANTVAPPDSACLPDILHFDAARKVMVMEYLGEYVLLHERLMAGLTDAGAARALGAFLGAAHASTHSALVPAERSAALTSSFENAELRGLQLEYVFTKCYKEAERAAGLRDDAAFMADVEALKADYRGETTSNLALCHGDFHAGSVMVDGSSGAVKVIDPEFAIYGPPGVDVGCLLSSYVLAAVYRSVTGTADDVSRLKSAASEIWEAYEARMAAGGVAEGVISTIGAQAAGFAGCEVARTALGFAGVRGLAIDDADEKAKAEGVALGIAERCIKGRAKGMAVVLSEMGALPTKG